MDPCPFIRILVGSLALKSPVSPKPAFSAVHPSSSPCFCKIKLKNFPSQITSIPSSQPTCFNLSKTQFDKLVHKSNGLLKIEIYTGQSGKSCGFSSGKLLGSVAVRLDGKSVESSRSAVVQNGWVLVNEGAKGRRGAMQLHLNVRVEPDPRFVFRSSLLEPSTSFKWLNSLKTGNKDQPVKERKGWSITIHDLSGSPVAAASMVTPFVPSPGTDRVSRSNPGAWLILRPGDNTWKPWGRLEAWRERGSRGGNHLGYRFDLLPDAAVVGGGDAAVTVVSSTLSAKTGGKFVIDIGAGASPASSRSSSFDLESGDESGSGSASWAELLYWGFVMSSTVEGGGRHAEVEVGVQHVACTEDAAAFVAVAAAMDLSVEACRPFSQNLRKGLKGLRRQQSQEFVV
ncbi:hypothetical protein RHGRI_032507 [Rhododendron griersonianum]|uniref:Formin-like protein n=1 Tax=Rhododendron griersonianum TaxID=479676 RepID=A0AAV6IHW3_9ERIC|nr:hypothetical protein RHGRI_032507 [Rhododendron griersonianum]